MSLGETLMEALRLCDKMRADGVPKAEIRSTLERTLRAAWPQTREWKFLCEQCRDYGLVMTECVGDATCGRTNPHQKHDFGRPCWCSKGDRFRVKEKTPDDTMAAAAKVSKPTRLGR